MVKIILILTFVIYTLPTGIKNWNDLNNEKNFLFKLFKFFKPRASLFKWYLFIMLIMGITIGIGVQEYNLIPQKGEFRLELKSDNDELTSGKSTILNVKLTNGDNEPISGEIIHFNLITNNSGAIISPDNDKTDLHGYAKITYTAGEKENVVDQIDAIAGRASNQINISVMPISYLSLSSIVDLTIAGMPIEITAQLYNQKRIPIKNEIVHFKIIENNSGGNISPESIRTDSSGIAKVKYIAGNNANSIDRIKATVKNLSKEINVSVSQLTCLVDAQFQEFPNDDYKNENQAVNTYVNLEMINHDNKPIYDAKFEFATVSYLQYRNQLKHDGNNFFKIGELTPKYPQIIHIWFDKDRGNWINKDVENREDLINQVIKKMRISFHGDPGVCVFYPILSDNAIMLKNAYAQ